MSLAAISCKEQINTRFISVLIYMSLRHFGHSWKDVESFLTSIDGMTNKACHKWTNILVNKYFDEFTIEERGRKRGDSFWDCYPDLELEAKKFVFEECSKTEATFTANSSRPYFLGYEREDVVKRRKEFVKYFIEREQHSYTITNDAVPQWKTPTTTATILLYMRFFSFLHPKTRQYVHFCIPLFQFKRLFQLLPFKNEYKNHNFVCLLDNARTHTAAGMHINDFGMRPGTWCPVDKIDCINENNKKQTIECYDDDGYSKGSLALAYELNVFVPKKFQTQ
ncbi:unnamed protein product [Rotaria magnacalcarata]|uniref:Uncharacterized protein n=2 Tax=Rotaria magnacalcarata TaxID=392030 RepID=A0A816QGL2_9BILA|nr:unnamed protein product [Rotaria magnacalcarata]CAF4308752.1 unnamed protein product [Rotaria magnacalcarata]